MILLQTERLSLRGMEPGMLEAFHEIMSDWEVVRRTGTWPWPPNRAFTASRCKPMTPSVGFAGLIYLADTAIGSLAIKEGALGYTIARAQWGRGYASEIARAAVNHAFATYDWPGLTADVFDDNPASARVLEKLGFVEGPRGMGASASRGGDYPIRTFTLAGPATP